MYTFLTIIHVLVSVALIAGVLMQSVHGTAGAGGMFGGAGPSESPFAKKKGIEELVARLTTIAAFAFIVTSLVLGIYKMV